MTEYGDIFEVSPPEAQGSATATLLVKNSTALDYDRGVREYSVEVRPTIHGTTVHKLTGMKGLGAPEIAMIDQERLLNECYFNESLPS